MSNELKNANTTYHEMRRLRYYLLLLQGAQHGPDTVFNEYGHIVYDYFVDFGSFANHVNSISNMDDVLEIKQMIADIKEELNC
jgi:hypothetical protein